MKKIEFEKLLEFDIPKHIIFLHIHLKIYLTNEQLEIVIKEKNRKEGN